MIIYRGMNIEKAFTKFNKNIRLSSLQSEDAKTKYNGVCKKIHDYFYEDVEYTGDTKFLFGSYKNKTNIIPFTEDQDIDVLFKIPKEIYDKYKAYESNGQSALLEEIRQILIDSKYGLGEKPKAWGKVILIKTKDNTHNIELLPALENSDKTFTIPNTENGGTWDIFNPREQVEIFKDSNKDTSGLTSTLIRMIKSWRNNNSTLQLKSYKIEEYVIDFLESYEYEDKEKVEIVYDFFKNLKKECDSNQESFIKSAISNLDKVFEYIEKDDEKKALEELGKIFGGKFPITIQKIFEGEENVNLITNSPKPWLSI